MSRIVKTMVLAGTLAVTAIAGSQAAGVGGGTCSGPACNGNNPDGWVLPATNLFLQGGIEYCIPYEVWERMTPEDRARYCHSVCYGISPGSN